MIIIFLVSLLIGVEALPLDEYVYATDSHYSFSEISSKREPGFTLYLYNMTSLKWKSDAVSDHPVWWHYLAVTVPDKVIHDDTALMLIDGGDNDRSQTFVDEAFEAITSALAVTTGTICADLKMIPNQPITFKADPRKKRRKEDSLVAWTWKQFLKKNASDPEILLQFPMTKAAVRGLDTIAAIAKTKAGVNINKFFVTGASKRGWTTWLTAAVDKRVVGIAPLVMDLLNLVKNLHHHYQSLGGWTFAFQSYFEENIMASLDSPAMKKMASYIDPLSYNIRYLSVPKMIISSAGDEFFLTDDSNCYYSQLSGPKYLRIVPDAEHTLIGHIVNALKSLRAFYMSILTNTERPKLFWKKDLTSGGGRITLFTNRKPTSVKAKFAVTIDNTRRDFRLFIGRPGNPTHKMFHPVIWFSDDVKQMENNTFVAEYDAPLDGRWLAFFIQVKFDSIDGVVQEYTTEPVIIPNTFPFSDCHGQTCSGTLV